MRLSITLKNNPYAPIIMKDHNGENHFLSSHNFNRVTINDYMRDRIAAFGEATVGDLMDILYGEGKYSKCSDYAIGWNERFPFPEGCRLITVYVNGELLGFEWDILLTAHLLNDEMAYTE